MPEGPEVQRYADQLNCVLANSAIVELSARTQAAKRWLTEHTDSLTGRRIVEVTAHGKNLIGWIEDDYYFYSHLMMWGRWTTFTGQPPEESDRRERARIITTTGSAILLSAPIFQIGQGDPYEQIETLKSLGPDILTQKDKPFDQAQFRQRLLSPQQDGFLDRTINFIGNKVR